MASGTPKISIAKPARAGNHAGLLPVAAGATQAQSRQSTARHSPGPRLKVVIRRLPPGLTKTEAEEALGQAWKLGGDRVDWMSFRPGKVSNEAAKSSRPSRLYLHLTQPDFLSPLSEHVRQTAFHDAKSTWNSSALLGGPSVEFAPYGRLPTTKRRKDARQGTIDQDAEFIAFLESLTNPAPPKASLTEAKEEAPGKDEPVKLTPLVQYLKDKKANKVKDGSTSKGSKGNRSEARESRSEKSEKKSAGRAAKVLERNSGRESKYDKAAKDAVKILNKSTAVSSKGGKSSEAGSTRSKSPDAASTAKAAPRPERKRERGSASAAARILQRDLGLGGPIGRRGASKKEAEDPSKGRAETSTASPKSGENTGREAKAAGGSRQSPGSGLPAPEVQKSSRTSPASKSSVSRGTVSTMTSEAAATTVASSRAPDSSTVSSSQTGKGQGNVKDRPKSSSKPNSSSNATAAFLKHVNASQGIIESTLRSAMAAYGEVAGVEIDKKKSFAYVDFKTPEALRTAIAASPVRVSEGQVTVMERRDRSGSHAPVGGKAGTGSAGAEAGEKRSEGAHRARGGSRGGSRGGRGRGRGGHAQSGTAATTNASVGGSAAKGSET